MKKIGFHKKNRFQKIVLLMMVGLFGGVTSIALGQNCTFTGGNGSPVIIASGDTITMYSTELRTITGQMYTDCTPYSGTLSCINGNIQGNYGIYRYDIYECNSGTPRNCDTQRAGGPIAHNTPTPAYSVTGVTFPQTCEDFSTTLNCTNGLLNGNYQTYQYTEIQCIDDAGAPQYEVDLILDAQIPGGENKVAQYSSPTLNIAITNRGTETLTAANIPHGFLQCERNQGSNNINIYGSNIIVSFVANPIVPQNISIVLNDIFTQSLGDKNITCYLNKNGSYYGNEGDINNNVRTGTIQVVKADRFDIAMERAISPIKGNLEAPEITSALGGAETIKNFIFKKVMDILVPLIIVIGILTAILGFYKMFFSSDENSTKEGIKFIGFGILGIILIMSAKFIGTTMYEQIFSSGVTVGEDAIQGWEIARQVYENLVYPFIKLAIYLVLGAMFIVLVGRTISFLFGTDEEAKKKAGTIIGRNIIAMILIIGAKQIVEAIYGKSGDVVQDVSNLGEIGTGILADKNLPILYQVINRAMGLTALAILIIIIFQTVQLLMKPDDADQMKSLKNSLLYIFIGLVIIGTGYLITNFLIIN